VFSTLPFCVWGEVLLDSWTGGWRFPLAEGLSYGFAGVAPKHAALDGYPVSLQVWTLIPCYLLALASMEGGLSLVGCCGLLLLALNVAQWHVRQVE